MPPEDPRTNLPQPLLVDMADLGMDAASLAADIRRHFNHTLGCDKHSISAHHVYHAVVITLRDRLMERWKNTHYSYQQNRCKRAYYLSMEWLMGRSLPNAMLNLGVSEATAEALQSLDLNLDDIINFERDAGLGNGGLGRLAACFVDSCATLQLPVMGHGIRYEYGIFRQLIKDGDQVEEPDHWLVHGNPWELERPEFKQRVKFGGRVEYTQNGKNGLHVRWIETEDVLAIPYDLPVPGYENGTVNTVRLWKAVPTEEFDLGKFSAGLYPEAVAEKTNAENITKVLYPNDVTEQGKVLRLRQQYFLTSAALQDVLRRWVRDYGEDFSEFSDHSCFQLNDTHPSIAVAELMRLLMDRYKLGWDDAWTITSKCMAYTNHTLLPEALEKWPVWVFREMLPRLLDIIYEINARFLSRSRDAGPAIPIGRRGCQSWKRECNRRSVHSFNADIDDLNPDLLRLGAGVCNEDLHDGTALTGNNFVNGTLGEQATHAIFDNLLKPLTRITFITQNGSVKTSHIVNTPHNERINDHIFLFNCQESLGFNIQCKNTPVELAHVIDKRRFEMQSGLNIGADNLPEAKQHGLFPSSHLKHRRDSYKHRYNQRQDDRKYFTINH